MQHQTYRKNLSLLGVASLLCLLEFELIAKLSDLAWYRHSYVVDQLNGQVTNRLSLYHEGVGHHFQIALAS